MQLQGGLPCARFWLSYVLCSLSPSFLRAAAQGAAATPRVKQIYKMDCAICHGDNGNGKTDTSASMNLILLDWTDPKSLADKKDQGLFDAIRKGTDKMPPEDASRVKDDEDSRPCRYIRGLSKNAPAGTPAPVPAPAPAPTTGSCPPALAGNSVV